jgi:NAD(P)-dependent dehydrogenase (short-subunit alcohol dehydrogenase family)
MFNVLVTGASRGIGLGVVEELLCNNPTYRVIATCRDPSGATKLQEMKKSHGDDRLLLFPLDVTSEESHSQLKSSLLQHGINSIDILHANAGVLSDRDIPSTCQIGNLRKDFETNVIGSILTLQAYQDLVLASKLKIFAVTSSIMGSLANAEKSNGINATYRVSKAALNMYCLSFSVEQKFKDAGCKMLMIHPVSGISSVCRFLYPRVFFSLL